MLDPPQSPITADIARKYIKLAIAGYYVVYQAGLSDNYVNISSSYM
jgi:hypothetical protein